tara:strand:- start:40 stop:1311 length:1272 start_codon:yes stop_codon:yes gene_type:complete
MAERSMRDALLNQDKKYDYGMILPFKTRRGMDEDQLSTDYMEGDISPAVPELLSDMYNASVKGGQMVQGERKIEPFEVTKIAAEFLPGAMAVNSTASKGMKGAILGANVFQGGPHKYGPEGAARSLDHMGKGEGAQAYGYGRYDAQNKAVADDYYKTFSDPDQMPLSFKDKPVDEIWNDGIVERWGDLTSKMTPDEVDDFTTVMGNLSQVNKLEDVGDVLYGFNERQMRMYRDLVEPDLVKPPTDAYLYKHDLPDDAIARYLDHDKPLSEQPEVFGQLKRHWDETIGDPDIIMQRMELTENSSGKDLYQALAGLGRDGKAASEALGRAGIPGLKYYDGMSRKPGASSLTTQSLDTQINSLKRDIASGGGQPDVMKRQLASLQAERARHEEANRTRNYVTWDQDVLDRMKLLERNGESMIDALR